MYRHSGMVWWTLARILVVAILVSMAAGCLGGCERQVAFEANDENGDPPEGESNDDVVGATPDFAITSNGETVTPYENLLWSETWTDESGWVSADNGSVLGDLEAVLNQLPTIVLREDIDVTCEDNVVLKGLSVYTATDYEPLYEGADRSLITGLPEGTYYCSIEVEETGRYIESEDKYEVSCSEQVFRFVVDEHSYDSMLRSRRAQDGISVMFRPTASRGVAGYYVPKDQDAWLEALRLAEASATDGGYLDEEVSLGIWIMLEDGHWQVMDSGCLIGYSRSGSGYRSIEKEHAADYLALVSPVAEKYYGTGVFRPDRIDGIVSATLTVLDETYTVTDKDSLAELETLLTDVIQCRGGTKCPFGGMLDLELQSGDTITLAVASDSCRVYMVHGAYFEYGVQSGGSKDNREVYVLFGASIK